ESDFLYRINRRVGSSSGIPNLEINRLSTWSAAQYTLAIRARLPGELPAGPGQSITQQYVCALELDINTAQDFPGDILPPEALPRIFAELVDRGMELAAKGDAAL